MADFTIEIAGHSFRIHSLFESTKEYCKRYLTEKMPEILVEVKREDLVFEQRMLDEEAVEEGLRLRKFQDPFLERTAIQRTVAEYLFDQNVLMLHGSTVAVDGNAYLFTAKCGTGKSTHTRLWCQVFGDRAVMVNDDKPFLKITDSGVWACGSPWSGKHGLDTNVTVPLQGICLLERGLENRIIPCDAEQVMPMLLHQGYCPLAKEKRKDYEALVGKLAEYVPLWQMQCNKDPQAAEVAYNTMK
jgi:hypothetical protein